MSESKKYVTCFLRTEFSPPELKLKDLYFQKLELISIYDLCKSYKLNAVCYNDEEFPVFTVDVTGKVDRVEQEKALELL